MTLSGGVVITPTPQKYKNDRKEQQNEKRTKR